MVKEMTLLFLHSNLLVTEEQMSHCMAASNGEGDDSALFVERPLSHRGSHESLDWCRQW